MAKEPLQARKENHGLFTCILLSAGKIPLLRPPFNSPFADKKRGFVGAQFLTPIKS
jgi:hypothetical protein